MVEGKWVAIIAVATGIGGFYLAARQSGKKMCNTTDFATHLTAFQTKCPTPNSFDIMRYYIGV